MKKGGELILKNKRGSHVGMIISFVVFITFVIFIFIVLKPSIDTGGARQTNLDDAESKITQNISSNFTIVSFGIAPTGPSNPNLQCLNFQGIITVLGILPPYRIIIKNESSDTQEAYMMNINEPTAPSFIPDIKINRGSMSNTFFRMYESTKFDSIDVNTGLECYNLQPTQYQIGSVYSGKYAFENAVRTLIANYNENYSAVKENLGISPGNDFAFSLRLSNGTVIEATQKTNAKNIYAQETPIQYIDNEANIKSGYIITKIW
jgi:hypothetical protein